MVRQLSIKDENSHSWTVRIILLLRKYQLPTAYDLLNSPPTKYQWKKQLKSRIHQYWTKSLYESVRDMSTLRNLTASVKIGIPHKVWTHANLERMDIMRASIKVKMMVGRYYLQSERAKLNGGSPSCPLCNTEDETLDHLNSYLDAPP